MLMSSIKFLSPLFIMIVCYILFNTHIINNLMLIEYISMIVIINLFLLIKLLNLENYLMFYMIILVITESVVGLSLMINMIRTHGNDFMKSTMILKF